MPLETSEQELKKIPKQERHKTTRTLFLGITLFMINQSFYSELNDGLKDHRTKLIAISKTKPNEDIKSLYDLGQRAFGENRAQELKSKALSLPQDIDWHFVGHLQKNKVKMVVPYACLIHAVDSLELLEEIDKRAKICEKVMPCLLQFHIATEQAKFGFSPDEMEGLDIGHRLQSLNNVMIKGVMGMATFTEDESTIREEFKRLKAAFDQLAGTTFKDEAAFREISMGMSGDYKIAMEEGSTMIRIGSKLFGARS